MPQGTTSSVAPSKATGAGEAADGEVEAIAGSANQEPAFSLQLSQEQRDIRDWVRGFAADVVRPAAREWDEREETPWPKIAATANEVPMIDMPIPASPQNSSSLTRGSVRPVGSP